MYPMWYRGGLLAVIQFVNSTYSIGNEVQYCPTRSLESSAARKYNILYTVTVFMLVVENLSA